MRVKSLRRAGPTALHPFYRVWAAVPWAEAILRKWVQGLSPWPPEALVAQSVQINETWYEFIGNGRARPAFFPTPDARPKNRRTPCSADSHAHGIAAAIGGGSVRAQLIDKDRGLRCVPGTLGEVIDADVARHLRAPESGDPTFE